MRYSILFIIIIMCALTDRVNAQPDLLWSQTYGAERGEECYSVIQTADNGFALVGCTSSFGEGQNDFWLVVTDEDGEELWSQSYGSNRSDWSTSIIQTDDGGFALTGSTGPWVDGDQDFWLVRTDEEGEELWSQTYGGDNHDRASSIIQTTDGGFALAGMTRSFGEGASDYWLVVVDNEGEELWSKTYGGSEDDWCNSLIQITANGFALAGVTHSFDEGLRDFWLVTTNEDGEELWSQTYGGSEDDICQSVIQTADNGFALAGMTQSFGEGYPEFWLVVTDEEGERRWSKIYGREGVGYCNSVIQTPDGGFALAGSIESFDEGGNDFWLVRTDEEGEQLWAQTYGAEEGEFCYSAILTDDFGYALAGYTESFGEGRTDFWLVLTEPDLLSTPHIFDPVLPYEIVLQSPYPNPFNSSTTIKYGLRIPGNVSLQIYNPNGQQVTSLFDGWRGAGNHTTTMYAGKLPSGLYFVQLNAGNEMLTQKVMLIR